MKKYCTLNNKNRKAPVWFKKKKKKLVENS